MSIASELPKAYGSQSGGRLCLRHLELSKLNVVKIECPWLLADGLQRFSWTLCDAQDSPLQQQIIWPKVSLLYSLRIPGLEKSQEKDSHAFKVLLICYDVASHAKDSFPYLTEFFFSEEGSWDSMSTGPTESELALHSDTELILPHCRLCFCSFPSLLGQTHQYRHVLRSLTLQNKTLSLTPP